MNITSFEELDYDYRLFPISRLKDLENWMNKISETNQYDSEISRYIQNFKYIVPEDFPDAQSILIVAGQSLPVKLTFGYNGDKIEVIIPPTYKTLSPDPLQILKSQDIKAQFHRIPFKLTAVCSGMIIYGRNNITYHPRWGSYTRLQTYITNLPPEHDMWQTPKIADQCEKCLLCRQNCPTNAIGDDRVGIHQKKCITLHNESMDPIPSWIEPKWHNALVGCMKCQKICPMNLANKDKYRKGTDMTENDTQSLFDAKKVKDLSPNMKAMLEEEGLLEDFDLIARNLQLIIQNQKKS